MVLNKNLICCEALRKALDDTQIAVTINPDWNVCLKFRTNGVAFRPFIFCPWCGKEFSTSMDMEIDLNICLERVKNENISSYKDQLIWWNKYKEKALKNHGIDNDLKEDIEEDVPFIYHPEIRTFGILKKRKFSMKIFGMSLEDFMESKLRIEFVPVNYCYLCGTKLPERLDDKLTEILQKEYGLTSWRDYKKAPKEFHTDEWWKKRGL